MQFYLSCENIEITEKKSINYIYIVKYIKFLNMILISVIAQYEFMKNNRKKKM